MEHDKIKELAEKYLEGMTSEEEETILRELISDPSLPSSLKTEYGYLANWVSAMPEPSDDFYGRLDALTRTETTIEPGRNLLRNSLRIAATVAVLLAVYFLADYIGDARLKDTYSDPQTAMAEVKSILTLVSENLNTGKEELGSVSTLRKAPGVMEEVERMNRVLEDNLGRLRYLNLLDIRTKEN
jgi:hypothetical protein